MAEIEKSMFMHGLVLSNIIMKFETPIIGLVNGMVLDTVVPWAAMTIMVFSGIEIMIACIMSFKPRYGVNDEEREKINNVVWLQKHGYRTMWLILLLFWLIASTLPNNQCIQRYSELSDLCRNLSVIVFFYEIVLLIGMTIGMIGKNAKQTNIINDNIKSMLKSNIYVFIILTIISYTLEVV